MFGQKTRYIFVDESGNWTFSKKGTQYLVFTSLIVDKPDFFDDKLSKLKYVLLENGHDVSEFHATENLQFVRDRVFECLKKETGYEIDSVIVEKCKTNPSLVANKGRLYKEVFSVLLRYVLFRYKFDKLIVFTDILPDIGKKEDLKKGLKVALKRIIPSTPFHLYHHPSHSQYCLQAVDYCSWAIYKKYGNWGNTESRPHDEIKHRIRSEFDLFGLNDSTTYY